MCEAFKPPDESYTESNLNAGRFIIAFKKVDVMSFLT